MKVEIKETKKERQDGFYKVKHNNYWIIAEWNNEYKSWYLTNVESIYDDHAFKEINERPIIFGNEFVKCKPKSEPFSPIELSLTIESKEELQELWHRMNMLIVRFKEFDYNVKSYQYNFKNGNSKSIIIWDKLDEIMKERNIKP